MLAAAGVLGLHAAAMAQPGRSMPRVGVLSPFIGADNAFFDTLRHRLEERGYLEGRNVAYVYRAGENFE